MNLQCVNSPLQHLIVVLFAFALSMAYAYLLIAFNVIALSVIFYILIFDILCTGIKDSQPSAFSGFIKKNQKAEINTSDSSSDSDHLTESDLELLDSAKALDKAKLHGNGGDGESRWKKNEQKLPKTCDAQSTGGEDFLEEVCISS